jgi:hypothetical protein
VVLFIEALRMRCFLFFCVVAVVVGVVVVVVGDVAAKSDDSDVDDDGVITCCCCGKSEEGIDDSGVKKDAPYGDEGDDKGDVDANGIGKLALNGLPLPPPKNDEDVIVVVGS